MLEAIHEPLMRTVALLEAARDAPKEVLGGLVQVVEEVGDELSDSAGESFRQMDFLLDQMRQTQPPYSNTGVRSEKQQGKQRLSKTGKGG